jgi:hypothetical protein
MFTHYKCGLAGKVTMWYQNCEEKISRPSRYPIPVPIVYLNEALRHALLESLKSNAVIGDSRLIGFMSSSDTALSLTFSSSSPRPEAG